MMASAPAEETPVLQVGDRLIEGWLVEPGCPRCGGPAVYFLAYEATCCPSCNEWLELLCPDPDCLHCRCRPRRPWPESS